MHPLVIRKAKHTDVAVLAHLGWQTFFDTFRHDNTPGDMEIFLRDHFNKSVIQNELNDPVNSFFIAYLGTEEVGYLKLSESEGPGELEGKETLEISRLYAIKEKIGSGVGSALMNRSIEIAKERNKEVLWLGVWEYNQRAIGFYRRFGFEKFGEHVFMLGNDKQNDWLLKKTIL